MNQQLNELHLFAGAGGGILGGILCGHTTVCAVEIEPYCRKALLQRQRDGILPKFPIWDDVQTFDGTPWRGKVDIICGGFPCQDISSAGKGAGIEGSRSSMWKHMARIIGEVRPRYAFVENSPMLVGRGLAVVLGDLAEMGYDAKWCVLGAFDAGAPHRRDRIWILATDSNMRGCDNGRDTERQYETDNTQIGETEKDKQSRSFGKYRTSEDCGDVADSNMHTDRTAIRGGMGEEITEKNSKKQIHATAWHATRTSNDERINTVLGLEQITKESQDVSNTDLSQRQRVRCASGSNQEHSDIMPRCSWWRQDPAEAPESNLGRMAHGVASRVDRLKAIGNGQVPAVAALAWQILSGNLHE